MNAVITDASSQALPMPSPTNNLAAQGRRLGALMILPAQLLLLFIVVFPLLMQIYISLTYWGPTDGVSWIYAYQSLNLFANYVTFFTDANLWAAIARTLFIIVVAVPLEFLLGLGLATLFVDSFPGRRVFLLDSTDADDGRACSRRIHVLYAFSKQWPGQSNLVVFL